MRSWILLGLFSLVSANPCTDPSSTREQFIEGGCCVPGCPSKSLSSGQCSDMWFDRCNAMASGAYEPAVCNFDMSTGVCSGGAIDFTQITDVNTNQIDTNPCEFVSPESCLSYVGCKVNEYNLCAQA